MKTTEQYLKSNGDDPQKALDAAVADVNSAHKENATARSFRRNFQSLLERLGYQNTPDDVDRLEEALSGADQNEELEDARDTIESLLEVMESLGVDLDLEDEDHFYEQIEAIAETLEEGQEALETLDEIETIEGFEEVARLTGVNPEVLFDQLEADDLHIYIDKEGDKSVVRVADEENNQYGELRAFAEENWSEYMAVLFPEKASADTAESAEGQGVPIVGQAGESGDAPPQNAFTEALSSRQPAQGTKVVSAFDIPTETGGN